MAFPMFIQRLGNAPEGALQCDRQGLAPSGQSAFAECIEATTIACSQRYPECDDGVQDLLFLRAQRDGVPDKFASSGRVTWFMDNLRSIRAIT